MVTEGQPVGCETCFDEDDRLSVRRPSASSATASSSQERRGTAKGTTDRARSSSTDKENRPQTTPLRDNHANLPGTPPAVETPPESPRVLALQSTQRANSGRRDSSFRKTYDENDQKRAIPCDNCALTLPKKTKTSEGNAKAGRVDSQPILRTRVPYERVTSPGPRSSEISPPKSATSDSSDSDEAGSSEQPRRPSRGITRTATSSSSSSFSSVAHEHSMEYISTHEPLSPTSFSIIRQSCLRTLSCETLPPSSNPTSAVSSPTSPVVNNPFSGGPSAPSTSSGGPILFGDPLAGYTTAYIFRIPDPTSRGRRRVYAFMALSTHREQLAVKAFSHLSNAFRNLAQWITDLAARELERTQNSSPNPSHPSYNSSAQSSFSTNSLNYPSGNGGSSNTSYHTPTSSFLSSRSNASSYMGSRGKGLAELVGLPDFFFELHRRFVMLLVELGLLLNHP
ncbi:hypothetical protein BP6252_09357 [Coleophoma cylindrospora]|uniref:UDENN FLCN/SMCR8-type domain-containing protein n=1 Tax=Coleophoma cylindrospora TaxID=1849047 RepID=A0A3D8R215_9HELO|nr:hypothetical protein BP6252_09357 [Coleophoma cylindrospora]